MPAETPLSPIARGSAGSHGASAPPAPSAASSPPVERRQRPLRASPLARWGVALYALALAYGTLYPLADWRRVGAGPFDFLAEPMPRYWTWFDLLTNVALYVPLGFLAALALRPRRIGAIEVAVATLAAAALSLGLEALQTYLPARIPSNLDWGANVAGALAGVLAGRAAAPSLLERGRLLAWRLDWFRPDASAAIVLLALWLVAQIQPQPLLMGTGQLFEPLLDVMQAAQGFEPGEFGWHLSPDGFILIEAVAVVCALGGVGAVALEALRGDAPRATFMGVLVAAALLVRTLATVVLPRRGEPFAWLTAGAQAGLVAAALALFAIGALRRPTRLRAGMALLIAGVVLVNVAPENAYYAEMVERWDEGRWLNFNGMTRWIATAWPYCALAYLVRRWRLGGRSARRGAMARPGASHRRRPARPARPARRRCRRGRTGAASAGRGRAARRR